MICIVEGNKYHYFREYLEGLREHHGIEIRIHPCNVNPNENILFVQKLLPVNIPHHELKSVSILNTEQLSKDEWEQYFIQNIFQCRCPIQIYDYSIANVKYLQEHFGIRSIHLPYKYTEAETQKLSSIVQNSEKIYDLAFIGVAEGRRGQIISDLRSKGVSIHVVRDKWSDDRDIEVGKCKSLLNLHFSKDHNIFEELRCNRWMAAGMPVISEESLYENEVLDSVQILFQNNQLYFSPVDKIAEVYQTISQQTSCENSMTTQSVLPRIFTFWTGTNPLTPNRIASLESMKIAGVPIVLISPSNLSDWILKEYPLHPGYEYLSLTQRGDYLKCYFMHHHGGGYSDIKKQTGSWVESFKRLNQSAISVALGYQEVPNGTALVSDKQLYDIMNASYKKLIGNGAYIFKARTFFTQKWYDELHRVLDSKFELLKLHPATSTRDHSGISSYPFAWTEVCGHIFHPICYKYSSFLLQGLPIPDMHSYL